MIVYGWNSRLLKEAHFPGKRCANCGAEACHIVVSASYAHIFWIPIFPYKKKLRIVCTNCGHEEKARDVSEEVKQMARQLKSSVRLPIWMFAGSLIMAAGISWLVISSFMDGQKDLDMIESPEVNDIYILYDSEETTAYKYHLNKVVGVEGDSVQLAPNSFYYNGTPTNLEPEDGFYDVYFTSLIKYFLSSLKLSKIWTLPAACKLWIFD